MPTPALQPPSPEMSFDETKNYLIGVVRQLNWLLSALDTLNINRLDAKIIVTGTLDAGKVTIRTDLNGGAYIVLDSNGIVVNNGTKDVFKVDTNGNVTLNDVTSTGGTIRTNTAGNNRVEISNNSLKTYNSSDQLQGPAWGTDVSSATYGDMYLYSGGKKALAFFNTVTNGFSIYADSSVDPSFRLALGRFGDNTYGRGSWTFDSTSSLDAQGTFKVHSGTAFDTISQSNSAAATLSALVTDFNTLLGNLRSMNILA